MAAAKGNNYAGKSKQWTMAIERALEQRSKTRAQAMDELAAKLLSLCDEGDLSALRELGDRLEGKPSQQIDLGNANNEPFKIIAAATDESL